ncbi:putative nuclear RNA export factor SDE5 [Prunus persica]|uniref:putative nuclear RNA export factor SDE5 n=1 Tax=Prunus persica TaxID=3760 RepID=UPI0009AB2578|nr:putative nuclear RNA export factor SDE5 [Prunus persica]
MQAFSSPTSSDDDQKRDLEYLLEVFSSMCSLKDIASAYCQERQNVEMAAEILCASLVSPSDGAGSSKVKFEGASATSSEGMSSDKVLQNPIKGAGNTRASKSKKNSVSGGTVSGMIGKEYIRPRSSTNESIEVKKPLKLGLKEVPASEIWSEEVESTMPAENSKMHADIEEFLFKMLGEGFKLDMDVIREVLGKSSYLAIVDMMCKRFISAHPSRNVTPEQLEKKIMISILNFQQSMENLLFMSASNLEKSDDIIGLSSLKSTEMSPYQHSAHSKSPIEEKDGLVLQKEVLEALFHVPERSEEAPKRSHPVREVKRYKAFRKFAVEPFRDTLVECKNATLAPEEVTSAEDGDGDNSYQVLRRSVKEHWITMKEYYKAAFDAFCEGDRVRTDKLLEEGHFYSRKAQEADEKYTQKLLEAQSRENVVSLDLHHHEPKEAVRLLRLQLTYFSGIPDFTYLKVIVGTNDTTGAARRRMIIKQLEKESIKWTEEENGRTIWIRLHVIDPKCLSFSRKMSERNKSSP